MKQFILVGKLSVAGCEKHFIAITVIEAANTEGPVVVIDAGNIYPRRKAENLRMLVAPER